MIKMTYVSILLIPIALLTASCAGKKEDAGAAPTKTQEKVDPNSQRLAEIQKNLQELNTQLELYRECLVSEEAKDCTELENKINQIRL